MTPETKALLEAAKTVLEAVAWLCAGGFFLYKAFTGYFIANMSVGLKCARQAIPGSDRDVLRIALQLTKGPSGTVSLHDARAKVSWAGETPVFLEFVGVDRRSFRTDETGRKMLDWAKRSEGNPFTNLSPGEATQFVCHCVVPSGEVCTVDAAVLGKVVWSHYTSQWRASEVAFPLSQGKGADA
jgi:hypothetical protein